MAGQYPGIAEQYRTGHDRVQGRAAGTAGFHDLWRASGISEEYDRFIRGASTTITEDSDGRQRDQITGAAEDLDHPPQDSLSKAKEETERKAILRALEICGGNKSKAAEKLEISRTLLYRKMKKYGIQ